MPDLAEHVPSFRMNRIGDLLPGTNMFRGIQRWDPMIVASLNQK